MERLLDSNLKKGAAQKYHTFKKELYNIIQTHAHTSPFKKQNSDGIAITRHTHIYSPKISAGTPNTQNSTLTHAHLFTQKFRQKLKQKTTVSISFQLRQHATVGLSDCQTVYCRSLPASVWCR
jgi:hypothetical protein